jgi:hypothetical protein
MPLANSREVNDERTTQDRARAAIRTYRAKPDERIGPITDPVSQRRHLDVDAVLERSLRRVAGE